VSAVLTPDVLDLLAAARTAEKEQALFYRGLAAAAEGAHDADLAERLNGLLADEQHHLSRLTVRLLEAEHRLAILDDMVVARRPLDGWEAEARERERAEIARYETLLQRSLDARTRALLIDILEAERSHEAVLGGKWMGA
jgi:rubrerythrin